MKKANSFSTYLAEAAIVFILMIFVITCLYPIWNIYVYSFNKGIDSLKGPLFFFPRIPTFDNFAIAFAENNILAAFKISILRTVIGTVSALLCTSSLAFVMTKRSLPGYKFFSTFFFITFMFSGGMIPYFLTIKTLGLYDNFWVYIIPALYSYWYMILFRSFFDTIPASIEESAWMDGASPMTVFFRLIIPMSAPVFAAVALFIGVGHWNDWFVGAFYIKTPALVPLQTLLRSLLQEVNMMDKMGELSGAFFKTITKDITPYSVRSAIVVITVTPIIMIYPFMQRFMVKGIMLGAVKG
jgi:putative aldouronate transport system permease protein